MADGKWKEWTFRAFLDVIFSVLYSTILNFLSRILRLQPLPSPF